MKTSSAVTAGDAALLLLHHHRLARREDALLVAVALRLTQILDHRKTHGLRRPEPEGARVADVERDDLVSLALELERAAGEAPADLVTDVPARLRSGECRGRFSYGRE